LILIELRCGDSHCFLRGHGLGAAGDDVAVSTAAFTDLAATIGALMSWANAFMASKKPNAAGSNRPPQMSVDMRSFPACGSYKFGYDVIVCMIFGDVRAFFAKRCGTAMTQIMKRKP
jgi:hypothetical protein